MSDLSTTLARRAPLHAPAQQAVLGLPALHDELAANTATELTTDVWFALWPAKPKISAERASSLAARKLVREQVEHVLAHEKRGTVLATLVQANRQHLSEDELMGLLGTKSAARAVAKVLVSVEDLSPELTKAAVKVVGGHELLRWLTTADCSDDEAWESLSCFADWAPRPGRQRSQRLLGILAAHPGLVARFASAADLALCQAAASSRHITDEQAQWDLVGRPTPRFEAATGDERRSWTYILMALVNNPVCHREVIEAVRDAAAGHPELHQVVSAATDRLARFEQRPTVSEPYESITDETILDWLVGRSVPKTSWDGDAIPGRPHDLAALARNPHLWPGLATRVYEALSDDGVGQAIYDQLDELSAVMEGNYAHLRGNRRRVDREVWDRSESVSASRPPSPPPPDLADHRVHSIIAGRAPLASMGYLVEHLTTTDEWRVALGLVESARDMTLSEFVDTVRAIA